MPVTVRKRAKTSDDQQRVDSVADIKLRWKVTDTEYDRICNSFQDTLAEAGVLGERFQGRTTQSALVHAIEKMLQKRQYQSVLKSIDTTTTRRDLRYLAQLLNQNYRRRLERGKRREADRTREKPAISPRERPWSPERPGVGVQEPNTSMTVHEGLPAPEDVSSGPNSNAQTKTPERPLRQEPLPLTARMLVVRWQDETASRIYRIQELCSEQDTIGVDGLDTLRYEAFMSILVTDFAFSPDGDVLLYNCVDEGTILVSNEKIWRAALWDMFNQDQRYFRFKLQRKGTSSVHAQVCDTAGQTV